MTLVNLTSTQDRLRYLKSWVRQSYFSIPIVIWSLLGVAGGAFGVASVLGRTVHTGWCAVLLGLLSAAYLALFLKQKQSLHGKFKMVFNSNKQARTVIVASSYQLAKISGNLGEHILKDGLQRIAIRAFTDGMGSLPLKNRSKRVINGSINKLPANDNVVYATVMESSMYACVRNFNKYKATLADDNYGLELPEGVQQYIKTNYPEMVYINPGVFGKTVLDSYKSGLYAVVQSLVAMSCPLEELRISVKEWLANKATTSDKNLPNDF